ncbi:MAG: class I SAM-dependent methyltransferase [Deltaproteobacteria bacterium]|nr:class I SAM-dependent methyltransferase [Deltaproteobacteria bacterium]
MAFYTDLSDVYDALFPVSDVQRALFDRILEMNEVRRVADAGCGSGAQLLHFASAGISCVGFDPDPALIAVARKKLSDFPGARVEVGSFADTARLVSPPADLVLCLGNSLVHVTQAESARFLADASSVTDAGGSLLLQILNYEVLFRREVSELPLLRAEDSRIEFRRRYVWEGTKRIRFQTALRIAQGDEPRILRNEIFLYPVYPEELWEKLSREGYDTIRFYGDFAFSEFTPESEALVCIARKS